jgi:hypothetical protein
MWPKIQVFWYATLRTGKDFPFVLRVTLRLKLPAPPKLWWPVRNMHDVMSKNTGICIKTALSTSNLARLWPTAVYFLVLTRPEPKSDHSTAHRSRAMNARGLAYTLPLCSVMTLCVGTGATSARCRRSFRKLTFQLLKSEPQCMNSKALRDCKRQTYDVRNR